VRVFKNTWFSRFARKEKISDKELFNLISRLEERQAETDMGGNVYKLRQARSGEGKRSGYRVIVFFKSKFRTFFVYGFSKSNKENIDEGELNVFKVRAKDSFSLTDDQINARIKKRTLIEIFKETDHEKI